MNQEPTRAFSIRDEKEYQIRQVMTEVYDLTRQVDPTRPVNDASGYQHVKTDLWTVHLYRKDAAELKEALVTEIASIKDKYEREKEKARKTK